MVEHVARRNAREITDNIYAGTCLLVWSPEVTQEFCYTIFVNTPPPLHQMCDGDALRSARVLEDPKLVLWGSSDLCSKTIELSEWFTVRQIRSSVTSKDGWILIRYLRPQSTKSRITATVVSPGVPVDGVTHYITTHFYSVWCWCSVWYQYGIVHKMRLITSHVQGSIRAESNTARSCVYVICGLSILSKRPPVAKFPGSRDISPRD